MIAAMNPVNVFSADYEYDDSDPEGYRCGTAQVGRRAGGTATTVKVYEIPAQQSLCPYHYEYEEEWLVVLEGEVVLRAPDREATLARGALVCFAPGPGGAHKVTNRGDEPAHVMMWSASREPAVAVYPDSDKVGVWAGDERDKFMFRRRDGGVKYYDGEV
jgi:uncharacterized cupin superfamily protein